MPIRNSLVPACLLAVALVAALPAYFWAERQEAARRAALELAGFDAECRLARFRLAQGGELWSARIMANRCDAAGR